MKKIIALLLMCGSLNAATINVANPGNGNDIQPNIQTAVNAAALTGDVILIPAGSFVFNNKINTNKSITLKGSGIGMTVLYRSATTTDATLESLNYMFRFYNTTNLVITGITFKSKLSSINDGSDGLSMAIDRGVILYKCLDFVITNCRFEHFGESGLYVEHEDEVARGVICHCQFYHNSRGWDGSGYGYGISVYGQNDQWIMDPKFGTNNFIFIEDNTFDWHRHSIAAGGCALYVARYNTITNSFIYHAIDAHGARCGTPSNGNYYGTRAVEIYNNTITNTNFSVEHGGGPIVPGHVVDDLTEAAIEIRGAEALVYSNTVKGFRFTGGVSIESPTACGPATYPLLWSTGYLSGYNYGASHTGINMPYSDGDMFWWNNNFTKYIGTDATSTQDFWNFKPLYFAADRDFHLVAKPNYTPYPHPHPKCGEPPLPIELLTFNGVQVNEDVKLDWTTASETNNDYFMVGRSLDGICFDSIAKVDGCGTCTVVTYYSLLDITPPNGVLYYRLTQIDYDGKYSYSNTIGVDVNVSKLLVQIYSDEQHVRINYTLPKETRVEVTIYDVYGQIVKQVVKARESSGEHNMSINVVNMGNGFCVVQFITDTDVVRKKIIINKH